MFRVTANVCLVFLVCSATATAQPNDPTELQSLAVLRAEQGAKKYRQGNLQEAANAYTESLKISPDFRVYVGRGTVYTRLKRYDKAIADFTKSIELCDDVPAAYTCRGSARLAKKEYELAISDFTRAIELDGKMFTAYLCRGQARAETKEYEPAITDYTRALALDDESVAALLSRAMTWIELEKYRLAISDLDRAIQLEPDDASLIMSRAKCWFFSSEVPRALIDVEKAIELEHNVADFYILRGDCRSENKEFVAAIQDYRRALGIDKDSKQAMLNLANLFANCSDPQLQDLQTAEKFATRACVSTFWNDWEPMLLLSSIQMKKGAYAEAVAIQEKSLDVAPAGPVKIFVSRYQGTTFASPNRACDLRT